MSDVLTPWGYSIRVDDEGIPPLLSVSEFRTLSGNVMSSDDDRVSAVLAAVSSVVRDWCGWHVAPLLSCSCSLDGGMHTLWLPCMGITSVDSLTLNGESLTFEWSVRGEVRLARRAPDSLRCVNASFMAGYDLAIVQALSQVVCQLAANALVATPGVREEHVGDAGVSYNQTASGVSGGVRLLASDRAALAPYRITTV